MALGTNYCRNPSGIYDLLTCYKMAVAGKDEDKIESFLSDIKRFRNVSEAVRAKVLKSAKHFRDNYQE